MTSSTKSLFILALCAAVAACNIRGPTQIVCTDDFRYGLSVRIQDSISGAGIASGATLIAQDGAYRDSVTFPSNRPDLNDSALPAAGERAGTYTLAVRRPGYVEWTRSGVQVAADECHVIGVAITARMRPE